MTRRKRRKNPRRSANVDKLKAVLKSRKFWAAIAALLLAFFGERAGVDGATLQNAIYTLIAYILGVALDDGLHGRN